MPGGQYGGHYISHEGLTFAEWRAVNGVWVAGNEAWSPPRDSLAGRIMAATAEEVRRLSARSGASERTILRARGSGMASGKLALTLLAASSLQAPQVIADRVSALRLELAQFNR